MRKHPMTRRRILAHAAGISAFAAAPAFLRHASAATPIKIGIPTVITGGYALLGSQVMRTCKLVKKMTDAKGGVLGQPVEFFYQDTQGDPATCVRKCQELVERDNCRILTGVIVSSEAAAMLPKLEEWNAIFISHGNGDGRLTAELFVPRFFRANTSAPMGARALALYLKDAPEKKFIAQVYKNGVSPRVIPFLDVQAAGALLQRAGFALPVTDVDRITVRYDCALALMRDLRRMGASNPMVERSRRPLRRATLKRMIDVYKERFADCDNRIRATFEIIWLSGWAPHASQQKPLAPGAAQRRLSDALGVKEISAGERAGGGVRNE